MQRKIRSKRGRMRKRRKTGGGEGGIKKEKVKKRKNRERKEEIRRKKRKTEKEEENWERRTRMRKKKNNENKKMWKRRRKRRRQVKLKDSVDKRLRSIKKNGLRTTVWCYSMYSGEKCWKSAEKKKKVGWKEEIWSCFLFGSISAL